MTEVIHETPRLSLRRFSLADAPFMLGLLNDPAFIRYVGDKNVRTVEDAEGYLRDGPLASYRQFGFGLMLVRLRESLEPIGTCGLIKRQQLPDVHIGFA